MSLDIGNLFKEMATVAGESVATEAGNIGGEMLAVLENNKDTLAELVVARTAGEINEEDFNAELMREKVVLEAELIALEIISKSAIQKAMNVAMETLTSAVKMAL